jgi:urease accessory protein
MTLRATSFARASFVTEKPWAVISLEAQERHVRRKLLSLADGGDVLVDLDRTVKLEDGDCLVLEDGRLVQIAALPEELLEVRGRDASHLTRLAWHIGNRHLEAQIEADRILIRPDHVIARMLEGQGATVSNTRETFSPEQGAYAHGH